MFVNNNQAESGGSPLVTLQNEHASNTQTTLKIQQSGTGDILNLFDSNTEVMTVLDGGNVGIGVTDPDSTLEILDTTTQLKLSNNADDYASFTVGTNGDLTLATVDAASNAAKLTLDADGQIELNAHDGTIDFKSDTESLMQLTDTGLTFDDATTIEATTGDLAIKATGTNANIAFTVDDNTAHVQLMKLVGSTRQVEVVTDTDTNNGGLRVKTAGVDGYSQIAARGQINLLRFSDSATDFSQINFIKRDSTSPYGPHTGDILGKLRFSGRDTNDYDEAASIRVAADADHADSATDVPGRIEFWTTPDGSETPAERMVIKSDGKVGIGISSPDAILDVKGTGAAGNEIIRFSLDGDRDWNFAQESNGVATGLRLRSVSNKDFHVDASATIFRTYNASSELMRIVPATGHVGIGTSSPSVKLDVVGDLKCGASSKMVLQDEQISAAGALTLNVVGDITLDADGGNVFFKDDGVSLMTLNAAGLSFPDPTTITMASNAASEQVFAITATNANGSNTAKIDITSDGNLDLTSGATLDVDSAMLQINSTDTTHLSMNANAGSTKTMVISATNSNGSNVSNIDVDADGTLSLDAAVGINIGTATDANIDIDASTFDLTASDNLALSVLANSGSNKRFSIDATNTGAGGASIQIGVGSSGTAISIGHTTSETTVNDNLTVTGNHTITGDLIVNGTTTTVNSTTIELDDKNIELAKGAGNNTNVDGGGITLVSTDGNKTINWVNATGRWTTNVGLHVNTTDALVIPAGNTGQRPTPSNGMVRYNTQVGGYEGYAGSTWKRLDGLADSDGDTYITPDISNELQFYTSGVRRMRIKNQGSIQIADASGTNELNVFGTIKTENRGPEINPSTTTNTFSGWTDENSNAFTSSDWTRSSNQLAYSYVSHTSDQKARLSLGTGKILASTLYEINYTVTNSAGTPVLKLDHVSNGVQFLHGGSTITLPSSNGTHVQQITSHSNAANIDKIQLFIQKYG